MTWKFSASQISTYLSCHRKWAWTYLLGLRQPSSKSQALGTAVHKQLENYLKGGQLDFTDDSGYIAASGLEHLPSPSPSLKIEEKFEYQGRHLWQGFKDLESTFEIWDHKTTSDLKWAKTEEELKYDPQAVLYAKENHLYNPKSINWVYYQTRKPYKSKRVHLMMYNDHIDRAFEAMEVAADGVVATREGAEGLDGDALRSYVLSLDYNARACEKYGGCPFRGLCNLSPEERFSATMDGGNKMSESLLDILNASSKPAAEPTPPPEEIKINPPEFKPPPVLDTKPAEPPAKAEKPKKNTKKAKEEAKTESSDAPEPAIPPSTMAPLVQGTIPVSDDGYTLYLDCLPVTSPFTFFDSILALARRDIFNQLNLADYRFAEYGQGPGILQQMVSKIIDETHPTALVVDTRTPEVQACLSLLKSRATYIVMSTK